MKKIRRNRDKSNLNYEWKNRNSEFKGYGKAFYINTDENDYLRADISKAGDAVRLYVELGSEGGAAYTSIIKGGDVTMEKSVSSNRQGNFSDKFSSKAKIFSTLPNNLFMKLVAGNYGIGKASLAQEAAALKANILEQTKKKYFKEKKSDSFEEDVYTKRRPTFKVSIIDLIDYFIGIVLATAILLVFNYDYTILGIFLAVFGVVIGAFDIFIRGKELSVLKMLIFVLAGIFFYGYGYFWI